MKGPLVLVCPPGDHERAEGFAASDDAISDVIADASCPPDKWFIVSLDYYESHFGTLPDTDNTDGPT